MEGAGHGESAPEKAQRRPRLATLDQGSMNESGNERQSRRRLTELPVKRKTSSDVPAEQGSTAAEEVGRWRERESFPRRGESFFSPGELLPPQAGEGLAGVGRCQRPRRDVLRGQENNSRPEGSLASLLEGASRRASLRRGIGAGEHERGGGRRRRDAGMFNFRLVARLVEGVAGNTPRTRVCAVRRRRGSWWWLKGKSDEFEF